MTTFDEQKKKEEKDKQDAALKRKAQMLPFKKFWLLYVALFGTGILSAFAGVYLGLAPDENGYFVLNITNVGFALYYALGFLATAEGATLFWETKYVYHDVDKDGKKNDWQTNTAAIALGVSIFAVIVTGLAAADFLAVWRGNLTAFNSIQVWAQGWVVWAIPVLFVFHAVCAIIYWYNSAEAALDRWKNQNRRQTQSAMAQVEADAWMDEYKRISPQLAKQKGAALARKAAMEDFYAEEEKLGVDLDGDGQVGRPRQNAPRQAVTALASQVPDYVPTVTEKAENAGFTQGQEPK